MCSPYYLALVKDEYGMCELHRIAEFCASGAVRVCNQGMVAVSKHEDDAIEAPLLPEDLAWSQPEMYEPAAHLENVYRGVDKGNASLQIINLATYTIWDARCY